MSRASVSARLALLGSFVLVQGCTCGGSGAVEPPDATPEASLDETTPDELDATIADVAPEAHYDTICPPSGGGTGALHGRIFGAFSFAPPVAPVYDITALDGGDASVPFATVPASSWLGPMVLTNDGKLYVPTRERNGSVWEISAGGDYTTKEPVVADLGFLVIEGLAVDADGNLYVANSGAGVTQLARVAPGLDGGTTTLLPTMFDNPTGLVVCGGLLFIAEGGQGRVHLHDLTSGAERVWASGFAHGASHVSGQMVVDRRGHLLLNWRVATPGAPQGVFDITAGGDFSSAVPLFTTAFYTDVNEIAVNDANDIFIAGADTGQIWVARAVPGDGGSDAGTWSPPVAFAGGLVDTESVGVGP